MGTDTALITGGAGFIGSALAHRLVQTKDVIIVDNLSTGKAENIPEAATSIEGDLSESETYRRLDEFAVDSVMHLAGQSSGEASFYRPAYDFESHAVSTFKLLQWCLSNDIDRLLYASSMSVYGEPEYLPVDESHSIDPMTYYAAGKLSAEAYVNLFDNLGMNNTIFRLFSVYGPGQNLENTKQGMVSIYLSFLINGETLTVKGPLQRFRDFVFIDDVVDAWVEAMGQPVTYGETYNIATGEKITVSELLDHLFESYGVQGYPTEITDGTPGDQFGIVGDASKFRDDLDWTPNVTLKEGLEIMTHSARINGT